MTTYTKWHDLAVYTSDPDQVRSEADRLDTSNATRPQGLDATPEPHLVSIDTVEAFGDKFEAIEVTDKGDVTVWTRNNVWTLRRGHGMEKLVFLPRHPIVPKGIAGDLGEWRDFVLGVDPDRMITAQARLDVSRAAEPHRVRRASIVIGGDQFEAMFVGEYGAVLLWTRTKVCGIRREGRGESLICLPRHPPVI